MDLTGLNTHYHHSTPEVVAILFCVLWPFLAAGLMSRRGSSSAPISALVVTVALIEAMVWWRIVEFLRYMPPAKTQIPRYLLAAGDSMSLLVWTAFWMAVLTLLRKHRPVPDAGAVALGALALFGAIGIGLYAAVAELTHAFFYCAVAAAALSLLLALAALGWFLLAGRQRA